MNRLPLILSSTFALVLASCAPSDKDEDEGGLPPIGYELAVARDSAATVSQTVINLSAEELELAREYEDVRLIDIRRDDEVAGGMIPGAEHIAMEEFDPASVVAGDDRPIILYCRSGRRSQVVGEQLASHQGKPAIHLQGGILAWQEAGRPVTTR